MLKEIEKQLGREMTEAEMIDILRQLDALEAGRMIIRDGVGYAA